MKILHICLASFYIDNYSYQENILPKYHKEMGLDVEIIASLMSFNSEGKICYLKNSGYYLNEFGIPVTRLDYYSNSIFSKKLRKYKGTYQAIRLSKPDIIFIHGCQFIDIMNVIKYVKKHPNVMVYVDNHADFSNSARNFFSKHILHKIIWRYYAKLIEPFTTKFYGVLPARVDFLTNVYMIKKEKVELLVMGADDEKVKEAKDKNSRNVIREKYNITTNDFLIITGGKIDNEKRQILLLMEAVKKIQAENVKLIIFGSIINELREEVFKLVDGVKIQYIGWVNSEESYKYYAASDLVIFPGRHSVFWEQVVGLGVPLIVKYWEGTTHVDLGGNCMFLYKDTVDEIMNAILQIINNPEKYKEMKRISETKGMEKFSYQNIAKQSIKELYK